MTRIFLAVFFGMLAAALAGWCQIHLLACMYRAGYERGQKDSAEWCAGWWAKLENQVERAHQEMRDEERWP